MQLALAVTVGVVLACGVYLILRRGLMFVALGIGLIGSAINLLIVATGRVQGAPALSLEGMRADEVANPLPQAFVLTAIVIGFAVVALVLALARRIALEVEATDPDSRQFDRIEELPSN